MTVAPASRRRHELDALRGFAMLLGIGLHASLAFFPAFWPVRDSAADFSGFFDEFFFAVHGFRMPLFFLLSGFFTSVVWQRRGPALLVRQRIVRVAVPLAIGAITIVPLMNRVVDASVTSPDIVTAIAIDDVDGVQHFIDDGFDLDSRGEDGGTVLHLAAAIGSPDVNEVLLKAGADPNAGNLNGDTPLAAAFAFGNEPAADLLVAYGAPDGRPAGVAWSGIEGWGFLADTVDLPTDDRDGPQSWARSLHHLWFLWFLCLLVAGYVTVAASARVLARTVRRPGMTSGIGVLVTLCALLAVAWPAQYLMGGRGDERTFGPDTSSGLQPELHVLGYYAIFFAFGALTYRARTRAGAELVDTLGRRWAITLPVTLVILLPVALFATFGDDTNRPWPWWFATLLQVTYTWAMVFALMGLFRSALGVERTWVRYLSDSAYWIYLAHLPLIIAGQAWIRDWEIPATTKFVGLCASTTLLLLVSYQIFVRYTPIGWLLNGRRARGRVNPESSSVRSLT